MLNYSNFSIPGSQETKTITSKVHAVSIFESIFLIALWALSIWFYYAVKNDKIDTSFIKNKEKFLKTLYIGVIYIYPIAVILAIVIRILTIMNLGN